MDEFVKAASSGDRSPEFAPREMAEEEALKSNVFKINNPHNISGKNALVCSDKEEATSPGPVSSSQISQEVLSRSIVTSIKYFR